MPTSTLQSASKSSCDSSPSDRTITHGNLDQTTSFCTNTSSIHTKYLFDGFPVLQPLKMALESDDSCDKSSCSDSSQDRELCEEMECDYFHKSCSQAFYSGPTHIECFASLEASSEKFLPSLHHALQNTESLPGLLLSNESSENPTAHSHEGCCVSSWNLSSSPKKKAKVEQKQKKRVSVNKVVTVVPIPSRTEYSFETRQKIWSTSAELYANAARNTVEFASEGWNWRNVLEEDQMLVHKNNGEFIHPIHVQNVLACMSQASEHTDEQRQLIEALVPSSSLFPAKDTDMVGSTPTPPSNANIVPSTATVSAQRAKECKAA
jgi:hypothetical protein